MGVAASAVQGWVRMAPKFARHVFITDRMTRECAGPDHEPAAAAMANSLYQWLTTYYPTFKLSQMEAAQLHMDAYRQQTLAEQGQAAADPAVMLMGEAPAPPPPPPPAPPAAAAPELAQQMLELRQQQTEFQTAVMARLQQLQPGPSQPAAAPADVGIKPDPEWPVVDPAEFEIEIDLCSDSSLSDYGSAESMEQ